MTGQGQGQERMGATHGLLILRGNCFVRDQVIKQAQTVKSV